MRIKTSSQQCNEETEVGMQDWGVWLGAGEGGKLMLSLRVGVGGVGEDVGGAGRGGWGWKVDGSGVRRSCRKLSDGRWSL
jgi:hypothetical protein